MLKKSKGPLVTISDLYPVFRCSVTEHVEKTHLNAHKSYVVEFFSRSDLNADWRKEYERRLGKHELESLNVPRTLGILKDTWHLIQEQRFDRYVMFLADGIMYGNPGLDYPTKEVSGHLINKGLYDYLGPSKVLGDVGSFDLVELMAGEEPRLHLFEKDEAVIVGRFIYMNGDIACELDGELFEEVLESPESFCDERPGFLRSIRAVALYHEGEILCREEN